MTAALRSLAQAFVKLMLMMQAGLFALLAILWGFLAYWFFSFGSWIMIILGVIVGLHALHMVVKACEHYLRAMPEMSPQQRQQYLNSALLLNPEKREAERRQRRRAELQ